MTDPVKEQLSACLDGELPEGELDLLLRQVGRDQPLRNTLGRYALIGETLRSQGAVAAPTDFATKISAAIAAEPALVQERRATRLASAPARWLKPVAGFAIAAGVAAVAILTLQQPEQAPTNYVADAAQVVPETSTEAASYIVPASTDSSNFVPAARLTNYVVAHSEYSSPLGRRSVLSGVLAGEDADVNDADAPADATDAEPQTEVINQR
jgi:negative regulator of sigma E activity